MSEIHDNDIKSEPALSTTIKKGRPGKYASNEETIKISRERENQKRLEAIKFKRELKVKHPKQFELSNIFATTVLHDNLIDHIYQLLKENPV